MGGVGSDIPRDLLQIQNSAIQPASNSSSEYLFPFNFIEQYIYKLVETNFYRIDAPW